MFKDNLFNVEELKREKAEYFHIGIPGLTKELEDDYMILFAGRPAMGKTMFLTRIAIGSCENKLKVAYFSLGLSKIRLMKNMVCQFLGDSKSTPFNKVYNKSKNSNQFDFLKKCYIFDKIYSSKEIHNIILDLDREIHGLDLVIIDGVEDITDYSNEMYYLFNSLSSDLNIRFIFSAKVGRECECRLDNRPRINDLKYSCNLMEHFSKIILLYREGYYDSRVNKNNDMLELDIYKVDCGIYVKDTTYETMNT